MSTPALLLFEEPTALHFVRIDPAKASLSIHAPNLKLHLAGSYETDLNENDDDPEQWPIPNLLAVRAP
ncbi:MAG: hypothetical protein RMA76_37430 [Deltaproteobacteria bacterium]|jgi:hypothetical protein